MRFPYVLHTAPLLCNSHICCTQLHAIYESPTLEEHDVVLRSTLSKVTNTKLDGNDRTWIQEPYVWRWVVWVCDGWWTWLFLLSWLQCMPHPISFRLSFHLTCVLPFLLWMVPSASGQWATIPIPYSCLQTEDMGSTESDCFGKVSAGGYFEWCGQSTFAGNNV